MSRTQTEDLGCLASLGPAEQKSFDSFSCVLIDCFDSRERFRGAVKGSEKAAKGNGKPQQSRTGSGDHRR